MAGQFRAAGHEIVSAAEQADLAVVNTCIVTSRAAADSRALIRRVAAHGAGNILATGCWATMRKAEALSMPGVLGTIPNASKDALVSSVLATVNGTAVVSPIARKPIPGARHRTRAFIKAQDGCDNHCSFCVTTLARGRSRSRAWRDVVTDVRGALAGRREGDRAYRRPPGLVGSGSWAPSAGPGARHPSRNRNAEAKVVFA